MNDETYLRGKIKMQTRTGQRQIPDQYWLSQGFAGLPLREEEAKDARWLLLQHLPMDRMEAYELLIFAIEKFIVTLFKGRQDD